MRSDSRKDRRARRHRRVRRKIVGSAERPRMSIMASSRHLYVQFVDDDKGTTLAAVSTLGSGAKPNMSAARALGRQAAEAALKKGIKRAIVDRGGFKFHGRVKAIVDAAREAGVAVGADAEPEPEVAKAADAEATPKKAAKAANPEATPKAGKAAKAEATPKAGKASGASKEK